MAKVGTISAQEPSEEHWLKSDSKKYLRDSDISREHYVKVMQTSGVQHEKTDKSIMAFESVVQNGVIGLETALQDAAEAGLIKSEEADGNSEFYPVLVEKIVELACGKSWIVEGLKRKHEASGELPKEPTEKASSDSLNI